MELFISMAADVLGIILIVGIFVFMKRRKDPTRKLAKMISEQRALNSRHDR